MRRLWMMVLLLLPVLAAASSLYRWVDDEGKVRYGDRPPPQTSAETLNIPVSEGRAPTPVPATPEAQAEPRLELQELQPLAAGAAPDPVRCDEAKQRLQLYQVARQLERPDEFGRAQPLGEEERAALIEGAREHATRACRGL